MNVTDSDEKMVHRAAEILLKDIRKVEEKEINPLNPENISNTAVEELIPETLKSFLNHICSKRNGKERFINCTRHSTSVKRKKKNALTSGIRNIHEKCN